MADVQNDEEFATVRGQIDQMIDSLMAEKGIEINQKERPNDVWLIDSRLAWHNIPDSYAVRLTINDSIAGMRVFNDSSRGEEDQYSTLKEAIEKTIERKLGEISRYKEGKRYKKKSNVYLKCRWTFNSITTTKENL